MNYENRSINKTIDLPLKNKQTKIHGWKIVVNNLTKTFEVSLSERIIFFNTNFYENLTPIEIEFCVRWAKVSSRKKTVVITEIDSAVIAWFIGKYSKDAFDCFLSKIGNIDIYNRLVYGNMVLNAKTKLWKRIIKRLFPFLTKSK